MGNVCIPEREEVENGEVDIYSFKKEVFFLLIRILL